MAKLDRDQPIQATPMTFQSIRDFRDFPSYLDAWIKPALLEDLRTVLEGARVHWDARKLPLGTLGRGDFVLGTALFSLFDHIGSLIAEYPSDRLSSSENIYRVAKLLPSTEDIPAIVANMGRNTLVHAAWPQTVIPMERGRWAFGLTLSASSELWRNDNLFVWDWFPRGPEGPHRGVLTLVLNVHSLRLQFTDWICGGNIVHLVSKAAFRRVKHLARCSGFADHDRVKPRYDTLKEGWVPKGNKRPNHCSWGRMNKEIWALHVESRRLVLWDTYRVRVVRDYGGAVVPETRAHQRKRSIERINRMLPGQAM